MIGLDLLGAQELPHPLTDCVRFGRELVRRTPVVGDQVEDDAKLIGARAKQMSALKVVPVSVAQALLKGAYAALDDADKQGTSNRAVRRATIRGKLDWHRSALGNLAATPTAIYPSGDDLKTWVLEAYVEDNISLESKAFAQANWDAMWRDIAANIAALPQNIRDKVGDGVTWLTGIPLWGWAVGGVVAVGLVGYTAHKMLVAAAPVAAKAYLGGR